MNSEYIVTDEYVIFWGSFLSNFHYAPFKYNNIIFRSSEQFFMWNKAKFFNDEYTASQILKATSPKETKRLGRLVRNFDESKWTSESIKVMSLAIKLKFDTNDELRERLLSFGDKTFVEGSPFDKKWGIGIKFDDPSAKDSSNWKGENLLGKIITEYRNSLTKTK